MEESVTYFGGKLSLEQKKGIFVRNTQEYYSENSVDLCIENIQCVITDLSKLKYYQNERV